ncbi:Thioredoxin domain protein [Gloeothece citriformis PCC 7424]|uniref:Thioredoxin domain protein n=1 Tax=Gloeothece citriformis (strain PCC 7424) TaxID=65393 RepID=B7KE40_GLOC7|nr:thioredoxin family protein [Gloeothece citriformis]ACK71738.1 Thioredoxin domain protein [Gloeothece citriformis PCC 7424]
MSTVTSPKRIRNSLIAIVAIVLSAAIFLGFQTQANSNSLEAQAQKSTPIDVALTNGKPTLTEFYADWCTSCQAMADDLAEIKSKYGDQVNFAMLNVDNSKWLPEILRYRVDGIPHFVYFNNKGEEIAQSLGEQPPSIIEANLDALIAETSLPYASSNGQISTFNPGVNAATSDPRTHSSQQK